MSTNDVLSAIEALEKDRERTLRALLGDTELGTPGLIRDLLQTKDKIGDLVRWLVILTGLSLTALIVAVIALVTLWFLRT